MGIKMTINKMRSEEAGREETRKAEEEVKKLKGTEKIKLEIEIIKSRMFNVEQDIKTHRNNTIFQHKLDLMSIQLKKLQEKLNNENNINM